MKKLFILLLFLAVSLQASLSEEKLKVMLIGKVTKYVVWNKKNVSDELHITILNNPFDTLPQKIYANKTIDGKKIVFSYIDTIDELQDCDLLYIPKSAASQLDTIFQKLQNKKIFTISDIRGFAQKGGMLQLYFISQKIKLKINLQSVKEHGLNIRSTLLRIAKVIKG